MLQTVVMASTNTATAASDLTTPAEPGIALPSLSTGHLAQVDLVRLLAGLPVVTPTGIAP